MTELACTFVDDSGTVRLEGTLQISDFYSVVGDFAVDGGLTLDPTGIVGQGALLSLIASDSSDPSSSLVLVRGFAGENIVDLTHAGFLYLFTPLMIGAVVVAPDADINNSTASIYLDDTAGATKLKVKAKDVNGTVRTGELALT